MTPQDAITTLAKYFHEIDASYDLLSKHKEGEIADLPNYVFGRRIIHIYKLGITNYYLIRVVTDNTLEQDKGFTGQLNTNEEIKNFTSPVVFDFNLNKVPEDYGMVVHDINVKITNNPNALPILEDAMIAIEREDRFHNTFSIEKAKKFACDRWNNNEKGFDNNYSFVHNLKKIFDKLSTIIKRKSFLERRIHRFINSHKTYILPSFKNCFFEHKLYFSNEECVADFILEREAGFPALLIELESPVHPVFKDNNDLTYQTNHAIGQINTWLSFIDKNSRNIENEMEFLSGPKDRLVIIGRGLNNIQEMKNSKFSGTTVWTYDLLIEEAKNRWNRVITEQCNAIGIENPNLL